MPPTAQQQQEEVFRLKNQSLDQNSGYLERILGVTDINDSLEFMNTKSTGVKRAATADKKIKIGLLLLYGSWNNLVSKPNHNGGKEEEKKDKLAAESFLTGILKDLVPGRDNGDCRLMPFCAAVKVDENEETLNLFIGDNSNSNSNRHLSVFPIPPQTLPCIAVVVETMSVNKRISNMRYISGVSASQMKSVLTTNQSTMTESHRLKIFNRVSTVFEEIYSSASSFCLQTRVDSTFDRATSSSTTMNDDSSSDGAIRIFVAGDRSTAGKSSTCLGILGSLLEMGYPADQLAYIKPATQSESTAQAIHQFCAAKGIQCTAIGPIVYYRGFTRAFLAGQTESTSELLEKASEAVDHTARNKKIILVDGVGFPAVGSICGTDNAAVAIASGYRVGKNEKRNPAGVLLIGGSGVGAAVDAFNLNATYFEHAGVPVMGAIFNKLSTDPTNFYNLENCREQVSKYFDQQRRQKNPNSKGRHHRVFGFVPVFPGIANAEKAMDHVDEFINIFQQHVDVAAIVQEAKRIKEDAGEEKLDASSYSLGQSMKHQTLGKTSTATTSSRVISLRTRADIEGQAISSGAAPSA